MASVTIVGVLADGLGAASQFVTVPYTGPGRNFDVRREYFSVPSLNYRSVQAASISVDRDHDEIIGEIKYLERAPNGQLHAVCEIDGTGLEGPLYFSPHIAYRDSSDSIELRGLAVCRDPATVGLPPIEARPGPLADAASKVVYQHGFTGQLIKRAHEYNRKRRRGEPLTIEEPAKRRAAAAAAATLTTSPHRPIVECRSAQVTDVSPAGRTVQIIAAPYNSRARVRFENRWIEESFSNAAFAKVHQQDNANRIRVWLNHNHELAVGRITDLQPFDRRGLLAEFKLSKTRLGDEVLELVRDDVVDGSVGFKVLRDRWEGRSHRHVTEAWLHHLGLTSDAAYNGTNVVGVRAEPSADPPGGSVF